MMTKTKYCIDCKWAADYIDGLASGLQCLNPIVNSTNVYILAGGINSRSQRSVRCLDERGKTWSSFPKCGIRGKLYEAKAEENSA